MKGNPASSAGRTVARAAPVGKRDNDQLVDRVGENRAELQNPFVVRAVAAPDCDRSLVKPDNIAELIREADVDGALVGGASLDPQSFAAIIRSVS